MIFRALLILSASFCLCHSAFVETLQKCSFGDEKCLKDLIQGVLKDISKNGIQEYDMPPIDPIRLKNIPVSVLGLINITLTDGVAKGVKDCVIDKINTEIEKNQAHVEVTCDIVIKGKFNVIGASPLIQNMFGGKGVHGDGNTKVKLDKVNLKLDYFYNVLRKEDGDTYIQCRPNLTIYKYDVGGMKLSAEKIFIGDLDISELIVAFLNENWKFIIDAFGKNFFDVAIKLFFDIAHRFFDNTPTKYYVYDDFSPYVTNI